MPAISVIMGVYNCKNETLLEKSIDSIIQQSYTDWEFFICNDGSTDGKTLMKSEIPGSRFFPMKKIRV